MLGASKVSVVVAVRNAVEHLDECISSVVEQTYSAKELIVIDGGSTDDTVDRLKRYGNRITWVSEKDRGQSDAIVKGFARAEHEWITWLNSDDTQCNRALWAVNDVVTAHPDADVVVGQGHYHYMDEDRDNPRPYPTIDLGPGMDVAQQTFLKGYMAQPSVFFRKKAYYRIGGINPALEFCMDYDL